MYILCEVSVDKVCLYCIGRWDTPGLVYDGIITTARRRGGGYEEEGGGIGGCEEGGGG